MAQITTGTNYNISITDEGGNDLYLTSTSDGGNATLMALEDGNIQQEWSLDISNELSTSQPDTSNGLYLIGDTSPCTLSNSQPSTRKYYIIEGDDTDGYTIEWWSIDPLPDGSSLGYLVPSGSQVKISNNPQKWKFTKTTKSIQGWEKLPRS